ncbi:hypothetical protein NQ317_010503 [Molorchus minor]|uniref:Dehydrogenase/reductase SDR family member 11 n=1 Tax=Molorchus minor TaxID=1323400 RepID=A0ABQ9ITD6_9CUCU|nr:hypothetical protein NQ317_010503 [Molorchus minor]
MSSQTYGWSTLPVWFSACCSQHGPLERKVAVVTGASAGIGASIAVKLVEAGVKVIGLARRIERVEDIALKLEGKPGMLYAVKCDISKRRRHFPGVCVDQGESRAGNVGDWRQVIDTNVMGLAIATREAIKMMQENAIDGHIVNVNSVAGHIVPPLPLQNLYPASKHASVSPGLVDTEIFAASGHVEDPEVRRLLDIAPSLRPEDVADAILYALGTPPHVQIAELIIKPIGEFV